MSHPSPPPPIVLLRVICHNYSHFGRNITREANFMSTLSLSLYSPPFRAALELCGWYQRWHPHFFPTLGDPPALSPLWMIAVINGHLRAPYWWRVMQQPPPHPDPPSIGGYQSVNFSGSYIAPWLAQKGPHWTKGVGAEGWLCLTLGSSARDRRRNQQEYRHSCPVSEVSHAASTGHIRVGE